MLWRSCRSCGHPRAAERNEERQSNRAGEERHAEARKRRIAGGVGDVGNDEAGAGGADRLAEIGGRGVERDRYGGVRRGEGGEARLLCTQSRGETETPDRDRGRENDRMPGRPRPQQMPGEPMTKLPKASASRLAFISRVWRPLLPAPLQGCGGCYLCNGP